MLPFRFSSELYPMIFMQLVFAKHLSRFFLVLFAFTFVKPDKAQAQAPEKQAQQFFWQAHKLYDKLSEKGEMPAFPVFEKALRGYLHLQAEGALSTSKQLLSIVDFTHSSTKKRLWVIDLANLQVLYHSLVAHGRNTGLEFAKSFSNRPSSYQSSMGFYVTGSTYYGKHGLSLYLHGKEEGFNDKAKARAIVMHGADYVSETFVQQHGRLGRSLGCPAVPNQISDELVKLLADGTCLFLYYPAEQYLQHSAYLKPLPVQTIALASSQLFAEAAPISNEGLE